MKKPQLYQRAAATLMELTNCFSPAAGKMGLYMSLAAFHTIAARGSGGPDQPPNVNSATAVITQS